LFEKIVPTIDQHIAFSVIAEVLSEHGKKGHDRSYITFSATYKGHRSFQLEAARKKKKDVRRFIAPLATATSAFTSTAFAFTCVVSSRARRPRAFFECISAESMKQPWLLPNQPSILIHL